MQTSQRRANPFVRVVGWTAVKGPLAMGKLQCASTVSLDSLAPRGPMYLAWPAVVATQHKGGG